MPLKLSLEEQCSAQFRGQFLLFPHLRIPHLINLNDLMPALNTVWLIFSVSDSDWHIRLDTCTSDINFEGVFPSQVSFFRNEESRKFLPVLVKRKEDRKDIWPGPQVLRDLNVVLKFLLKNIKITCCQFLLCLGTSEA